MNEYLSRIFDECYYIGAQLIRYKNDIRRVMFQKWIWAKYTIPPFVKSKRAQLSRGCDSIVDSCMEPFRDISAKTKALQNSLAQPEAPATKRGIARLLAGYLYSLGRPINHAVSFFLPILGCAVLAATLLYFQQLDYALEVEYAGRNMGYVRSESEFYDARAQMNERLDGEEYIPANDSRPTFRLVIADPGDYESVDSLANQLLAMSQNDVTTADGIYVDNAFLGAVEDGNEFLLYIDGVLQGYRTGTEHEKVQFVKKVVVREGVYPVSAMRPVYAIKSSLESQNAASGLGIQVTRRETYTEDIDFETDYKDDDRYPKTYEEVISGGAAGKQEVVADVVYVDGVKSGETRVEVTVTKEPVNERKMRGTLSPVQYLPAGEDTGANFIWPMAGGTISCELYGYGGHTGLDIRANTGTGIYAARPGTVVLAYNYSRGDYGKHLYIDHGNGVTTRYAHASEVMVKVGQYVRQGQLIAKVGRTGRATGPHLHFEIRINGRVMNPVDFIGRR